MQQILFNNHFIKALVFGCLFSCGPGRAKAQGFADTAQRIDRLFEKWKRTNGPGASIEISRNGQTLYRWYGGMADLEHGVAVDSNSVFEAGSVSKQFTAAAVLLLAEQGSISLQDDIRRYFPELPDYGQPIRIYHLLHHTSGLRDWGSVASVEGWERGSRAHTNEDVLAIVARQRSLNNVPGAEYIYSNSNFNLMALLVERVTKISFASFCRQQLFDKAGMRLTRWRNHYREVVPNRTIGYQQ
ncbi:MAG: serine hydrolase domain-containing protein, partial [Flavihumibacter sp.]